LIQTYALQSISQISLYHPGCTKLSFKSVEKKENVRRNALRDCRIEKVPVYKPVASPKKNRQIANLQKFIDEMRRSHEAWKEKTRKEEAELDAQLEEELRQWTIKIEEES
jgi:hypothetical protein